MIDQSDMEQLIQLIEQRRDQVLEANNLSETTDSLQYSWVQGIYNDIIEFLKIQY